MGLRPGYKQTDIGVIPEDWEAQPLPNVAWFQEGPGVRTQQFTRNGVKLLNGTNIYDGNIFLDRTDRHISIQQAYGPYRHFLVDEFDIVIASSGITIEKFHEKIAIVRNYDLPLCMNTSTIRFKNYQEILSRSFLFHFLQSEIFKRQIGGKATGSAQLNFGPSHLKTVTLPSPHLPEQRAIAAALSDVDATLAGLERLVTKKRDLKQAAMQQLLTGQTRLPGFAGDWEVKRFGDLALVRGQKVVSNSLPSETLCIELEHLESGTGRVSSTGVATGSTVKNLFKPKDVLFGRLRAYLKKFWLADVGGVCSTEIWPLVAKEGVTVGAYLYHTVQREDFIERATQSYGTHMPRTDWSVVRDWQLLAPDVEEQTAIATVLSDMESEIEALEAQRDKMRMLKQAMMQALLTGRVRLPVDQDDTAVAVMEVANG